MEDKRASLAEKLDTLENHVLGTVQEATEVVSHTVEDVKSVVDTVTENVKETVENVTETVKHTFDMGDHVRRHPWGMFCGAIAVGFAGGRMLAPKRSEQEEAASAAPPPTAPRRAAQREERQSGMGELLHRVQGLALGALMKVVRDVLAEALPETMKEDVMTVVDEFTTKLGGKPVPAADTTETDGAHTSPAAGEQTHEEQSQSRSNEPGANGGEGESRPQGKKGQQPSGGRFERRNPPPRR
jgi:ElaB/YqjD/DUF883 family membrane-anchored ribosome-binding protein